MARFWKCDLLPGMHGGARLLKQTVVRLFAVFLITAVSAPAVAQRAAPAYPAKFIRIIVPYAAGAGPDMIGRTLAEKMSAGLGQNIVFENRGGGGGVPGTDMVAKAAPDGYTLLLQTANYASYPIFYRNLPYDPAKDLLPVSLLAKTVGFVLVVNPSLPVKNIKELIALAKANPGKLNHGTSGFGSQAELFSMTAGVSITMVRYAGVPAVLTDVISGQIEMGFPAAPSAMPFIQSGRLRVLGITADKRWGKLPAVPTFIESGLQGYNLVGWYGLWFPAGTPAEFVGRIQQEVAAAMRDPAIVRRLDEQGIEALGLGSAELVKATADEYELNRKLAPRLQGGP
jgi:tripartite-type tricarboxylate transporter receptor subunit TctC